jgi:hypothetical protein
MNSKISKKHTGMEGAKSSTTYRHAEWLLGSLKWVRTGYGADPWVWVKPWVKQKLKEV